MSMRSYSAPDTRRRYRRTCSGAQRQRPLSWPYQPHGQGFIAATSWNCAGKCRLPRRARDEDDARLERFAQHFDHAPIPFRQFVEEQHAVMRERYFAGTRHAAAAHERDAAGGVMRRAKRPHAPALDAEMAGERGDGRRFERFGFGHRRQQRREAMREHRLARSRRTEQQQRMKSGRGDFEHALGRGLAANVGEVRCID